MDNATLLIDGENLRHYIEEIIAPETILDIDLDKLFSKVLHRYDIARRTYYSARLRFSKFSAKKSMKLIKRQRILKTQLTKKGFSFILGGNVRAQPVNKNKPDRVIFHEKGVDVRLAVELVTIACDKTAETVVLCSSDSDLQPAIKEAINRGIRIVYLGFERNPNKGLLYTTSENILIKDRDVLDCKI